MDVEPGRGPIAPDSLGYQVSAWALADDDRSVVAMANRNDDGYSVGFSETFAENALCVA